MTTYELLKIKDSSNNSIRDMVKTINILVLPEVLQSGYSLYGIFFGLFGLATNEIYLMTIRKENDSSTNSETPLTRQVKAHNLNLQESYQLTPTVRPTDHTGRSKNGIYVFRWFLIYNRDVEAIVQLSDDAWVSFEGDFESEVQGLFCEKNRRPEKGRMLLLTWYRDLSVWEKSRQPAPEAREKFLKRHKMMIEALPIATRLFIPQ